MVQKHVFWANFWTENWVDLLLKHTAKTIRRVWVSGTGAKEPRSFSVSPHRRKMNAHSWHVFSYSHFQSTANELKWPMLSICAGSSRLESRTQVWQRRSRNGQIGSVKSTKVVWDLWPCRNPLHELRREAFASRQICSRQLLRCNKKSFCKGFFNIPGRTRRMEATASESDKWPPTEVINSAATSVPVRPLPPLQCTNTHWPDWRRWTRGKTKSCKNASESLDQLGKESEATKVVKTNSFQKDAKCFFAISGFPRNPFITKIQVLPAHSLCLHCQAHVIQTKDVHFFPW